VRPKRHIVLLTPIPYGSNFRLILETVRLHGFVVTQFYSYMRELPEIRRHPWEFPLVIGCVLQIVFTIITFGIEWLLSRKKLNETLGMMLHYMNAHSTLAISVWIVWTSLSMPPAIGAILLLHATMTWMKLISYAHANEDYRLSSAAKDSLRLVENVDLDESNITYPENVTLSNLFYFWLAPSLTYQIAFPKYPDVRLFRITGILVRLVGAVALFSFLAAQVVTPALEGLVKDLEATNGTYTLSMLAEYGLRLSIANTYLWLLMFYAYFHLYLNLFAELLRFGDRVFYKVRNDNERNNIPH
jgi:diacylglycerol O-acyltransferase-1